MRRAITIGVFALVLTCCSGDPNEQANKLFVEVQQMVEAAGKQGAEEKFQIFSAADEKLKSIIAKYPAANLAVQLASGQSVGSISLKSVANMRADAAWPVCAEAPKRACILDQALRVAQSIGDEGLSARVLHVIAETQTKQGLTKDAAVTLAQALLVAQSIKDEGHRAFALSDIAGAQAKAGLTKDATATLDQALRVAQSIGDEGPRAFALSNIAEAQAKAGKITEAIQLAQSIKNDGLRARAFSNIAEALPN